MPKIHTVKLVERQRASSRLLKKKTDYNTSKVNYTGSSIIQDSHFNALQKFVFMLVDKMGPLINKHPKLYAKIMKIGGKILQNSDELQSKMP